MAFRTVLNCVFAITRRVCFPRAKTSTSNAIAGRLQAYSIAFGGAGLNLGARPISS